MQHILLIYFKTFRCFFYFLRTYLATIHRGPEKRIKPSFFQNSDPISLFLHYSKVFLTYFLIHVLIKGGITMFKMDFVCLCGDKR